MKSQLILLILLICISAIGALLWCIFEFRPKVRIEHLHCWRDLKPGTLVFWNGAEPGNFILRALVRWFKGSGPTVTHVACITQGKGGKELRACRFTTSEWGKFISYPLRKKWPLTNSDNERVYDLSKANEAGDKLSDIVSSFVEKIVGQECGESCKLSIFKEIMFVFTLFMAIGNAFLWSIYAESSSFWLYGVLQYAFGLCCFFILLFAILDVRKSARLFTAVVTSAMLAAGLINIKPAAIWEIQPEKLEEMVSSLCRK